MELENWFLNHPKLRQMQSYGLGNPSQMYAAMHTYLDLTEVKVWSEVGVHPCAALRAVYLTAREREADPIQLVLPLPSTESLSMERFATLREALKVSEGERNSGQSSCEHDRVTVALVDGDSAILYYHMWEGIHP